MPQISADMYVDPFLRSIARVNERARIRYRKEMLALIANPKLTDRERMKGFHKAKRHEDAANKKEREMRDRHEREVLIPEMIAAGVLRPPKPAKRRSK